MIGLPTSTSSRTSARLRPAAVRPASRSAPSSASRTAVGQLARRRPRASSRTTRGSSGPRRTGSAGSSRRRWRGSCRRRGPRGGRRWSSSRRPPRRRTRGRGSPARRAMMSRPPWTATVTAVGAALERRLERAGGRRGRAAGRSDPTPAQRVDQPARSPVGVARSAAVTSTSAGGAPGRSPNGRAVRSLRTTWRWTWQSGGTSMTASPRRWAVQDRRRSASEGCSARRPRRARRAGQVRRVRRDAVLGERAERRHHLAAAADAAGHRTPSRCRRRARAPRRATVVPARRGPAGPTA